MGKRTSVYLNPLVAGVAEQRGDRLALLVMRGASVKPLLVEDIGGGFVTHWYCAVPDKGTSYRVMREYWVADGQQPVREIYEITPSGEEQRRS